MENLNSFREWLLINGNSQASAKTHSDKIASFFRKYESFTQENLNSFLSSKIEKWNGNSYNFNINAFIHYAKFLKVEIEIPKYHKTEKRIKEYISEKDFYDILSKIPVIFEKSDKIKVIFTLLFELGLRPKELLQLKRKLIKKGKNKQKEN